MNNPVATAALVAKQSIQSQVMVITTVWELRIKVPAPVATGTVVDLGPEMVSLTYIGLALLVGAAYVSRAQALRVASSVVGGAVFSVFVTVVPISMRWRQFVALEHSTQSLIAVTVSGRRRECVRSRLVPRPPARDLSARGPEMGSISQLTNRRIV